MPPVFSPRLVNGPFGDPALYLSREAGKRALLFDLGEISALATSELLAITHVFVSHTHMDHFIGFDHLLRCNLGQEKTLHLFGPVGILENVAGRLAGYSWNLLDSDSADFVLMVTEIDNGHMTTRRHAARNRFNSRKISLPRPVRKGRILEERRFSVSCAVLDHHIPCLGFRLDERFHIRISLPRLEKLGLAPGPWIAEFKAALYREPDGTGSLHVPSPDHPSGWQEQSLQWLSERICDILPGRSIAYITDAAGSDENNARILDLVQGVDHLFIEAMFRHDLTETASRKRHLTARQAGDLAGRAAVRHLTPFHFSPRYEKDAAALLEEVMTARRKWMIAGQGATTFP